mgnify:CR=1 FL=1
MENHCFHIKMKRKAIFLDRDGVINEERKDYVKNVKEFKIKSDVGKTIKILKDHGFLVIIITNQSAINRKILSVQKLNEIHDYFNNYLKKYNTFVDGIYFCPHTPNENCECRKPKPGLLLKAKKDFDMLFKDSWMIGDSQTDIEVAKTVGCNSILLASNDNLFQIIKKIC